jgi:ElaB/YqjD/DUF883 family membrane-anchored ribosome-binding protein
MPISPRSSSAEEIRETASQAKENIEQITEDFRQRANRLAREAGARASDAYDDASEWLQDNYGKAAVAASVLAAVGALGYFIARRQENMRRRT